MSNAIKNIKVNLKKYIAVSLAIAISMVAFLFSLSFNESMKDEISAFKEKNTAFNIGYIKGKDSSVYQYLIDDDRIDNVYYQYKIENIDLKIDELEVNLFEKFPTPKSKESMSYGVMPGDNQIAITPSLAKKFSHDIKELLGKEVKLKFNDQTHTLIVSGIYKCRL